MKRTASIVLAVSLVSSIAAANTPASVTAKAPERTFSINVDPMSGLFKAARMMTALVTPVYYLGANAEWLHGKHGVLVEAIHGRESHGDSSFRGVFGTVGWRYHWLGRMNSGFAGVNVTYGACDSTDNIDGTMTAISARTFQVTGNVGKRWQFDNGINITTRFGVGSGTIKLSTDSDELWVQQDVEAANQHVDPLVWDTELSMGYSF